MKNTILKSLALVAVFLLAGWCREAAAQAVPDPGRPGAVERSLQQRPVQEPARLPEIIIQEDGAPRIGDAKVKFLLREIIFDDNLIFSPAQLTAVIAPWLNKTIEVAQLAQIADAVTRHYREAGYFLTRAFVPPQAIRDGKVAIKVREGRLGDIIIKGNQRYSRELLRNTLKVIRGEGAIRTADVERALLLLMDNPGLRIKATFKPGNLPATSDIVLEVSDERFYNVSLDYNNFGSRYVSQDRFGINFDLLSPFKFGDIFSVRAVTGVEGPDSLFLGRIEYAVPLGYSGARLGINYSAMQYEVIGELRHLNAAGKADTTGLWFSYPLVRGRNLNWFFQAGFEAKNLSQEINRLEVGRDKNRHAYLGTSFHWVDEWQGSNYIAIRGYQSFAKILSGMDQNDKNTIRLGTDVIYSKVELDVSRIQRLFLGSSLLVSANSQWTGSRMPSAEQLQLGGPGSVRGYSQSERSVDSGVLASAELRFPIPGVSDVRWGGGKKTIGETLQLALFYDYGKGWISDATLWGEQALDGNNLQGAGVGVRFTYSPYVRFKVDWAKYVGGLAPQRKSDKDNGVWHLQAVISF